MMSTSPSSPPLDSLQIAAGIITTGLLALLVLGGSRQAHIQSSAAPPIILGAVETLHLESVDFPLEARVDSGAALSSLDARNIREFGTEDKWVSFEVEDRNSRHRTRMCLPIIRHVEIKRHNRVNQCRPVVRIPVTLGESNFTTEFTLIDRSNLRYPVLIGRQDIQNRALIDVSLNHIHTTPNRNNNHGNNYEDDVSDNCSHYLSL